MTGAFALFLKTYFLFAGGWWSDRLESEELCCAAAASAEQEKTKTIHFTEKTTWF